MAGGQVSTEKTVSNQIASDMDDSSVFLPTTQTGSICIKPPSFSPPKNKWGTTDDRFCSVAICDAIMLGLSMEKN